MFSKYELLFLDQANSSFDRSQILILQFLIPRASLPATPFLSNVTLANWNPLQHNPHHVFHQFPSFVLNHSTTSHHKYWIYPDICKFVSKLYTDHNTLWVHFSFKVRQHGQQQLYLQHKVCWILYKMVGTPSFSQPYLCIQSTLQSPPKIRSSTSVNFHLPIPPLLVHKIVLTILTNTPFLYTSAIFHLPLSA